MTEESHLLPCSTIERAVVRIIKAISMQQLYNFVKIIIIKKINKKERKEVGKKAHFSHAAAQQAQIWHLGDHVSTFQGSYSQIAGRKPTSKY